MQRLLLATVLVIFGFAAAAPAGPGDSEPSGTLPYSLIHCPSTISHLATTEDVWVHCHNMIHGYTLTLYLNNVAAIVKTHTVNQPWPTTYPGTWDDYNKTTIGGLGFTTGSVLTWHASVVDNNNAHHDSYGSTTMN